MLPVEYASATSGTLRRAAAAEQDRRDRHARRDPPTPARSTGTALAAHREPGVRVRGGVVRRPACQLRRASRWQRPAASAVMPSHQTSPSAVSAVLVKIGVIVMRAHRVRVGLDAGARRDAEEPGLRVDRVQPAVGAEAASRRCRRRSSRPSSRAASARASRGSSCRTPTGTPPRRSGLSPAGGVSLRMSMCSASQPSSRAIVEAMRRAKHFLPRRAFPP